MSVNVRRHALGVLALVFLTAAVVLWLNQGGDQSQALLGFCSRLGLILGVLWMAFPQVQNLPTRLPTRLVLALVLGGLIVVARPRVLALVAVIVALIAGLEFAGRLMRNPPARGRRS
jgi:hypothetical protein